MCYKCVVLDSVNNLIHYSTHLAARDAACQRIASHCVSAALQRQRAEQLIHTAPLLAQRLRPRALQLSRVQQHLAHSQLWHQRIKLLYIACTYAGEVALRSRYQSALLQGSKSSNTIKQKGASSAMKQGKLPL